jgi:solute carrier family 6 (neurotransmitter transporter, GABA) member 1
VNGPLLFIVYSFSYANFADPSKNKNPAHIFGFIVAHVALFVIALGFLAPRWFNIIVSPERREDGNKLFAPNVTLGIDGVDSSSNSMEAGSGKLATTTEMPDKELPAASDRDVRSL